jgi:ribosome-binding protein aMBF1 (putative translation factor)
MKRCEVCGSVEGNEETEIDMKHTQFLHVCENCQNDRKHNSFDPEE